MTDKYETDILGAIKEKGDVTELLIHDVPMETKQKFKVACAIGNISMREVIIQFMDKYAEMKQGSHKSP